MKIIAKKSFALLLAVIMVFGLSVITFADAQKPVIKVSGTRETPTAAGTVHLALTAKNLSTVKGMDLTITAPSGVTFTALSGVFKNNGSDAITLTSNDNYTLAAQTIHIVSAFVLHPATDLAATITLTCNTVGEYTLPIEVKLATDEETLIAAANYDLGDGDLVIGKYSSTVSSASGIGTGDLQENCFLPFGAIYYSEGGKYIYPAKSGDGSFSLNSAKTYNYTAFKVPSGAKGISTFSASRKAGNPYAASSYDRGNAIQFVSYGLNKTNNLGTIIFKGNFEEFCLSQSKTKKEMFQYIATSVITVDSTWYSATFNDGADTISFARIPCSRSMWESSEESGAVQFALRVYNIQNADLYTAVAYKKVGETYTFSETSITKSFS